MWKDVASEDSIHDSWQHSLLSLLHTVQGLDPHVLTKKKAPQQQGKRVSRNKACWCAPTSDYPGMVPQTSGPSIACRSFSPALRISISASNPALLIHELSFLAMRIHSSSRTAKRNLKNAPC